VLCVCAALSGGASLCVSVYGVESESPAPLSKATALAALCGLWLVAAVVSGALSAARSAPETFVGECNALLAQFNLEFQPAQRTGADATSEAESGVSSVLRATAHA
jgi:hypothetical protein